MSEKQKLTLGRQSRKYLLLPIVIACAELLASCGGGSDTTSTAESADGTKEALAVLGTTAVPPGWTGRAPKMEVINGITVPPEPAQAINNATVVGVDVNKNGVRDDIERHIASEFGRNADAFQQSTLHAKSQQLILTGDRVGYLAVICGAIYKYKKEYDTITNKTINTDARIKTYKAMTDAPVTVDVTTGGCR